MTLEHFLFAERGQSPITYQGTAFSVSVPSKTLQCRSRFQFVHANRNHRKQNGLGNIWNVNVSGRKRDGWLTEILFSFLNDHMSIVCAAGGYGNIYKTTCIRISRETVFSEFFFQFGRQGELAGTVDNFGIK